MDRKSDFALQTFERLGSPLIAALTHTNPQATSPEMAEGLAALLSQSTDMGD